MKHRIPTQLLIAVGIIVTLVFFSCSAEENIGMPAKGKIREASGSAFPDQSLPTPQRDSNTIDAGIGRDAYHVVLRDKFGFMFRLNLLNKSGRYDIYEGESTDPGGNRYPAAGIYNRVDGKLSVSSSIHSDVPYYSNLEKASDTDYRGYEQLISNPWEHYRNTYQIIEGRLD